MNSTQHALPPTPRPGEQPVFQPEQTPVAAPAPELKQGTAQPVESTPKPAMTDQQVTADQSKEVLPPAPTLQHEGRTGELNRDAVNNVRHTIQEAPTEPSIIYDANKLEHLSDRLKGNHTLQASLPVLEEGFVLTMEQTAQTAQSNVDAP